MSDRLVKLIILDQDPIFRYGLSAMLNETSDCEVIWNGDREADAWDFLGELMRDSNMDHPASVYMLLLELGDGRSEASLYGGIRFCQQIKSEYPQVPILVLSAVGDVQIVNAARNGGVDGWCVKGASVTEIQSAIESILAGQGYWDGFISVTNSLTQFTPDFPNQRSNSSLFTNFRQRLHQSGNNYINDSLRRIQHKLKTPGLPLLEQVILAGRSRELLAAKWLLDQILPSPTTPDTISNRENRQPLSDRNLPVLSPVTTPSNHSPRGLQAELFANCANHLQQPLHNVSDLALEIDILLIDKKRELLYLVLQNLANQLEELRNAQLGTEQINQLAGNLIQDLWETTVIKFFGKFSRIKIPDQQFPQEREIEISQLILQDRKIVNQEILAKIPRVADLIVYLIHQTDWYMENEVYQATHPEAKSDAQIILENLLIQVANATIQPLINRLADIESIKQNFYNRQMLSSREIERFRNNLSWKYRFSKYYLEPKAIFESRYHLFVFAPRGIAQTSVYAPRQAELSQLRGIPLFVTIGFEFRDAIAPRLQSLVSVLGSAVVFVLTQVVGRGLGLVAKGILQGIGSAALPNMKNRK